MDYKVWLSILGLMSIIYAVARLFSYAAAGCSKQVLSVLLTIFAGVLFFLSLPYLFVFGVINKLFEDRNHSKHQQQLYDTWRISKEYTLRKRKSSYPELYDDADDWRHDQLSLAHIDDIFPTP